MHPLLKPVYRYVFHCSSYDIIVSRDALCSDSGPGNPGWSCAYDDNFDTLINPFALSPDVLNGYYDAVSRYDADGSAPQYFSVKYQGVGAWLPAV